MKDASQTTPPALDAETKRKIYRSAWNVLKNDEDAEEIAADIEYRYSRGELEHKWLRREAKHRAIDRLREQTARMNRENKATQLGTVGQQLGPLVIDLGDPALNVYAEIVSRGDGNSRRVARNGARGRTGPNPRANENRLIAGLDAEAAKKKATAEEWKALRELAEGRGRGRPDPRVYRSAVKVIERARAGDPKNNRRK